MRSVRSLKMWCGAAAFLLMKPFEKKTSCQWSFANCCRLSIKASVRLGRTIVALNLVLPLDKLVAILFLLAGEIVYHLRSYLRNRS